MIPGCTEFHWSPLFSLQVPPAQAALVISRQVRDVAVRAGESAMFECHMTGPQDVEVDWLSNGKLIQPALLNCKMHFDGKRWVYVCSAHRHWFRISLHQLILTP